MSLVKVRTRKRTTTQTTIMYSRSSSTVLETDDSGLRATAPRSGCGALLDTAEHRPHDRLLVRLVPRVLAHDPSCPHRDDAMREPSTSPSSLEMSSTPSPSAASLWMRS